MSVRKKEKGIAKDYGVRMDPELAVPMTHVAIGLGKREGKVGPLALDSLARRALRKLAEREGLADKLVATRDDMASKHDADQLLRAAGAARKIWIKYPIVWGPVLTELLRRDRSVMHCSDVWRSAVEAFCIPLLKKWANEETAAKVSAEVTAEVSAA